MEKNKVWTRDIVEMLLLKYQEHENLYNVRDPNYMNRVKRSEAFFKLYEELRAKNNNVTVEGIKSKIHTLRTQYVKELREITNSKRSGVGLEDVYQPKLWCFDQMDFLKPHCETRKSTSNIAFNEGVENSCSGTSFLDENGQFEPIDSFGYDTQNQDVTSQKEKRRPEDPQNQEDVTSQKSRKRHLLYFVVGSMFRFVMRFRVLKNHSSNICSYTIHQLRGNVMSPPTFLQEELIAS